MDDRASDPSPAVRPDADAGVLDVVIIGAGFAGLIMALELKRRELGSFVVLEKADEIGGTWRENTYPGAACDIASHLYSIESAPKSDWSRMFGGQAEIQAYLRGVARERSLYAHIRLGQSLAAAVWDGGARVWTVTTEQGHRYRARSLVSAVGGLHRPAVPKLAGLDRFEGVRFHSARWNHRYDLSAKRVAVIGTGASAIQFIPEIAPHVAALDLYQRTAAWVLSRRDYGFPRIVRWAFAALPGLRAGYRRWLYVRQEFRHRVFRGRNLLVVLAEALARRNMHKAIGDRALRAKLTPAYRIGCKRILQSNDYYPALARSNVDVVTTGIREVRAGGIVDDDGVERAADAIIFATGFHTTDAFDHLDIRGHDGVRLGDAWSEGLEAHRGTVVAGFPNFYMLLGPNTGLGHNSIILMIEAQAAYIGRMLAEARQAGIDVLCVRRTVQAKWCEEMQQRLAATVWQTGGCRSWYQDESGKNTVLWPGTVTEFRARLAAASLDEFEHQRADTASSG